MLKEIVEEYSMGKIDFKEYGKKMFKVHEVLLEYAELLKSNMIENIQINKDEVIVDIKSKDDTIKMKLNELDEGAVVVNILNTGDYEQDELYMTLKLLEKLDENSVIFDIGANLGWYTVNIMKNFKNNIVYAFEPVVTTYQQLKRNLEINNISTKNIYNFGLYNENKILDFFYNITESGASSITNLRENNSTKKIQCNVKKLDCFVEENHIEKLDFIKCDVEGSEIFVYQGGLESIKKFKPIVFSEMLRKWSAKFGYHPNDIISLFRNIDYKCFVIKEKKLKEIKIVDESTIETNYFFLHKNKHKNIINYFNVN